MARTKNRAVETQNAPKQNSQRTSWLVSGPRDVVLPRLVLMLCVLTLTIIGLVMVYSSSSISVLSEGGNPLNDLAKQAGIAAFSIIACLFVARFVPYYAWLGHALDAFWAFSLILLLLTALIGTVGLGAQRWLVLGPISFQPSEFAKVAFVLMMARIMYQVRTERLDVRAFLLRTSVFVVAPLLLLYITQSDLGTTLICAVGIVTVLWLADVPWKPFAITIAVLGVLGVAAVFLVGYRSDRMVFLNPEADYYGSGYQLVRSFYAFGEGGLFGVGLGNSTEKYLYLPEAETDFIFSIIGEELGLIGALAVVAMFVAILLAGLKISKNAPDLFATMIAGGCTVMLVFQAFLNIGCVLGMLPTTGKPLPFISSGGSSMIGSYLLVCAILSVSFASGDESGIYDRRRADLRVVRSDLDDSSRASARSSSRQASGMRTSSSSRSTSPQTTRSRTSSTSAHPSRSSSARSSSGTESRTSRSSAGNASFSRTSSRQGSKSRDTASRKASDNVNTRGNSSRSQRR